MSKCQLQVYDRRCKKLTCCAVLLMLHSNGTQVHTTTTQATAKVEKVWRPTISSAGSTQEWSYFLTCWKDYTTAAKLKGKDMVIQLLQCCEEWWLENTSKGTQAVPSPTNPMTRLMTVIKKLALQEENTMVAGAQLHNMCHVWSFWCSLMRSGQCKFLIKCPAWNINVLVNYTKNTLYDVVTCTLADSKIQLDFLDKKN